MMMEDNGSKNVLLSVLGVAILVVAVVGISFALFSVNSTSDTNSISTGTIAMSFSEAQNGIMLTSALPTSDDQGKAQTTYFDFSVSTQASGTNVSIPYTITVTPVPGSGSYQDKDLTDSQVKVYLTTVEGSTETAVVQPTLVSGLAASTIAGRETSKTLYETTATGTSTATVTNYRLRMWIDSTVDATANQDKQYTLRVNADATVDSLR